MKSIAIMLLACPLSACVVHLHIHEAPKPAEAPAASASQEGLVSGVVLDAQHRPVGAHVSAVDAGGSSSVATDQMGRFAIPTYASTSIVVHASTADGRVAVQSARTGARDLELVLGPGTTLVIDLAGGEHARCAVFQGALRIEDFTLRAGKPASVVVPPGALRVQIYEGDQVLGEQSLSAAEGLTKAVSFKLGS
jgi:hypothetical protein